MRVSAALAKNDKFSLGLIISSFSQYFLPVEMILCRSVIRSHGSNALRELLAVCR